MAGAWNWTETHPQVQSMLGQHTEHFSQKINSSVLRLATQTGCRFLAYRRLSMIGVVPAAQTLLPMAVPGGHFYGAESSHAIVGISGGSLTILFILIS